MILIPPGPSYPQADPASHPALDLAHRLDAIFFSLLHHIAAAFRPLGGFAQPAWTRVSRASQRLRAILRRIAAGTFPPPRRAPTNPDAPKRQGGPRAPYLPRRRGWLGHLAGYQARNLTSQLNHLLADPQTHATLAAAPPHARAAFARALATTARLLALDLPPLLQPPIRAKPNRPTRAKPPRPSLPPLFPPIPPNILAAARAWKRKPR